MRIKFLKIGFTSVLVMGSSLLQASLSTDPALAVECLKPIVVLNPNGVTATELKVEPLRCKPTHYEWSQVADSINPLASRGTVTFTSKAADFSQVVAQFTDPGVYQLAVTAKSGALTLTRYAWVHVWENRGPLDPGPTLGHNPEIAPPDHYRKLSPDPGPFHHPRILFCDEDWPEMSKRAQEGAVAAAGVNCLKLWVKDTLDNPDSSLGKLAESLNQYATHNYSGEAPDLALAFKNNSTLSSEGHDSLFGELLNAAYLQWLAVDPAAAHSQASSEVTERQARLCRIIAAASHVILESLWDRKTGAFHTECPYFMKNFDTPGATIDSVPVDLALAFDLIYDWMSPEQQKECRDLFYAISYYRHSSNGIQFWPGQGEARLGTPKDGFDQNGDFDNLNDQAILPGLMIEGEETVVSPDVVAAFGSPPSEGYNRKWMQPADPSEPAAWPNTTKAMVDNLQRELFWNIHWFLSPWGFATTHYAYYGFSGKHYLPSALAFARRGENAFITSYMYEAVQGALYTTHPGEGTAKGTLGSSTIFMWDHHDSGSFGQRGTVCILWKYLFPEDPAMDWIYRSYLPTQSVSPTRFNDPLLIAMFGQEPGIAGKLLSMEEMATQKKLPLIKFDPQKSIAIIHNGWKEEDAALWYDCGWDPYAGHMHAEKNSFAFYALGRAWCFPPGYHCTISDAQSTVLIQDPRYKEDPVSEGYIGESPSSATQKPPSKGNFPTPSGRILEVKEDPGHQWSLLAGDASYAYKYGFSGERKVDTNQPVSWFMYPGMYESLVARCAGAADKYSKHLMVSVDDYNPVMYAFRSIFFARGTRPYVLVVDDINKDDTPHNYRWTINSGQGFAPGQSLQFIDSAGKGVYSSLALQTDSATPSQAIFYHSPIDDEKEVGQIGLPRLLIRDLSETPSDKQPAIHLDSRPPSMSEEMLLPYGVDNNRKKPVSISANRVMIERDQVVEPKYKVLLFPYRTGEPLPKTSWNANHTELIIDLQNGVVDHFSFDTAQEDHRTRIGFKRTGH